MPDAARVADPIAHTQAMNGLLAGIVAGAVIGAAAVLVLSTGGAALPFVIAGAVAGASALGGIGEVVGSLSSMPPDISGAISIGSPNVSINGRPAAHAHFSICACSHHSAPILVAQGSNGVTINGSPASRVGDLTVCSAKISAGSSNVTIGGGTITTDQISPEIPTWVNDALMVAGFGAAVVLGGLPLAIIGFAGSWAGGKVGAAAGGAVFGEGSDGQKICALAGSIIGGVGAAKVAGPAVEVATPAAVEAAPPEIEAAPPAVEEPAAVPSSEEVPAASAEEPASGSNEPTGTSASDEPSANASSDEPSANTSSDEPSANASNEEPSANSASEEPSGNSGSSEEPEQASSGDENSSSPKADEEPTSEQQPGEDQTENDGDADAEKPSDANADKECELDPIDVISGEVNIKTTDFVLPGVLPIVFNRTYCSGFKDNGCLGPKWRSTWGAMIQDRGGSVVSYISADGLKLKYKLRGRRDRNGWHSNPLAPKIKLRRSRNGFEVLERDRTTLSFEHLVGKYRLLNQISHPNGHAIHFTRARSGALQMVEHSGGYRLHITGTATQIWQIFLELSDGTQRRLMAYQYDERGYLTGIINGSNLPLTYSYDAEGRITRWADREGTWYGYTYDAKGRVVVADGSHEVYCGTLQYDEANSTTIVTDSLGYQQTYKYDNSHHVVEHRNALGAVTRTIWNRAGLKTAEIDPNGNLTAYEYDPDGNLLTLSDANGKSTHFTYNQFNLPNSVVDAAGHAWLRDYDGRGNLLAAGLSGQTLWRYERDFAGNLVQITDPEGRTRRFSYDPRGLPVLVTDALGNQTRYVRDDYGRIVSETNALGHQTSYKYNELNKLSDVTLPDGSHIHWDYNLEGLVTRRIAADGSAYTYVYGAFDKLAQVNKPAGGTFRFAYDLETRVRAIQNERGELYTFEHDPLGRIVSETDFTGRKLQYEYDPAGFCIKRINGAGETSTYKRDNLGRLLSKLHSDGTEETFTYDALGNLVTATNSATRLFFERDAYGRVTREKQGEYVVDHTYDKGGLRTNRSTSTGTECSWTYDPNGQLSALHLPNDEQLLFDRDALGRETTCHFGPDFELHQSYDSLNRLTHQDAGLIERTIRYDSVSNPIEINDKKWGKQTFSYDPDGRLISAARQNGLSEEFEYDPAGNIATTIRRDKPQASAKFRTRLLSYGGRLELIDNTKYFYDKDGRVTEKWDGRKIWKYQWSVEGRLKGLLTPNGQRWNYEYDPLGRRVSKTGPTGTTKFMWDGPAMAEVISPEGHKTAWFYQPGTFRPVAKVDQEAAYACVTDQIGTPKELVTKEGKIAWSSQLTAFGELEKATTEATTRCQLRFQGQYRDEESGLHYNLYRYYEPQTGRYLSPDPIGLDGGTRSYGYVHNPISWVDPVGLAGTFGTGKPPHVANVTVTDAQGNVTFQNTFQSGSMTPEEAALGFPQNTLATHTEARAVSQVALEPGDTMLIEGQYPPCPSCKGKMNAAAVDSNSNIKYTWPEEGETKSWSAKTKGC